MKTAIGLLTFGVVVLLVAAGYIAACAFYKLTGEEND